jgi:hypothetical protein
MEGTDKDGNDYKTDSLPSFNMELKGNSAEGNIYEPAMKGYGATAAPARHADMGGTDAPGAFIRGSNKGNDVDAGSEMSGNTSFNPGEN